MRANSHRIKPIVASILVAVGISVPLPALADAADIDRLLDDLAQAEPGADRLLVTRIFTEWSKSGSPAVDLLLQRGTDAIEGGDPQAAIEHFTAAIDHAPDFAEAYHGRATAYYLTGRIGPALDDLRQTLVLNPRHFRAMQGFGVILGELGREEDALEVFRQVHQMHPADPDVARTVEELEQALEGQAL